MTSFTRPDLIACPHCGAKHERVKLRSFNDFWATYYSDGGSSFAPYKFCGLLSRCTACLQLIVKTYDLPTAGEVVTRKIFKASFWRKLVGLAYQYDLVKPFECPRLPFPSLPDWREASEQANLPQALREQCEYIFMLEYNQLTVADKPEHTDWLEKYQSKHRQIEDKLLASLKDSKGDTDLLLCADILRRRGEFDLALQHLEGVASEAFLNHKRHLTQWVNEENTVLMAISIYDEAGYDGNCI